MTATISKAQLKRDKEINKKLYTLVSRTIVDFKDSFFRFIHQLQNKRNRE